jgi:hypothetical protein
MNKQVKIIILMVLSLGFTMHANANQEVYLSISPNLNYHVEVEQHVLRRFGKHIFYRYPIYLVNRQLHEKFQIQIGTPPLIHQTRRGTFIPHFHDIQCFWSPNEKYLIFKLKIFKFLWKTYLVQIGQRKTIDLTPQLEQALIKKMEKNHWHCQDPDIQLLRWFKFNMPIFKITDLYGTSPRNTSAYKISDTILYGIAKNKVLANCFKCNFHESQEKFIIATTPPTPTPTPVTNNSNGS